MPKTFYIIKYLFLAMQRDGFVIRELHFAIDFIVISDFVEYDTLLSCFERYYITPTKQ